MELRRGVSPVLLAAMKKLFHPVVMVHLDWPNDPIWVHSGVGSINWDGQDWLGVGEMGGIKVPGEQTGLAATDASLSLMGVPPEIYEREDDQIRGHVGEIYVGAVTENAGTKLIGDPVSLFSGSMDSMIFPVRLEDGELIHAIEVGIRAGVGARGIAQIVHSPEDQKANHPNDTAGRHLVNVRVEAEKLTWPES